MRPTPRLMIDLRCMMLALLAYLVGCAPLQRPVGMSTDTASPRDRSAVRAASNGVLRISFLNVGLGDAVLISCPDNEEFTLIDAGDSSDGYPQASEMLRATLEERMNGVSTFARTINTHPHPDHVAGFLPLFASGYDTLAHFDDESDFPEAISEERLRRSLGERYRGRPPSRLTLCGTDSALLEQIVLTRDQQKQLNCPHDLNACSLTFRLTYQGNSVLLLADVTKAWEQVVLADRTHRGLLPAVVMKVGHHASHASTSVLLLDVVSPELAVITVGSPGQGWVDELGYPRYETVQRVVHHFEGRFPDEARVQPLDACRRQGSSCVWEGVQRTARVRATSVDGSIDVELSANGVRVVRSPETR